MITIRRKPLGFQSLRKPQTLGMRLLTEGVQRMQTHTVQRITPSVDVSAGEPDYDAGLDVAADYTDYGDGQGFDGVDVAAGDPYDDAVQAAIRTAEAPDPTARPAARPTAGVQRSTGRGAAPPNRPAAQPSRQGGPRQAPPAQRPPANAPVQRQPAPPPVAPSPSGAVFMRQQLSEGDNMPTDLKSIMALHQQRAQQPAESAGSTLAAMTSGIFDVPAPKPAPAAKPVQRSTVDEQPSASIDDDAPRPRRRAKIVDITPPKKGLPLGEDPIEVPTSASPLGAPIQREARNAENLPPRPAPLPVNNRSREVSTPGTVHREVDESGGSDDEPGRGAGINDLNQAETPAAGLSGLRRPDAAFESGPLNPTGASDASYDPTPDSPRGIPDFDAPYTDQLNAVVQASRQDTYAGEEYPDDDSGDGDPGVAFDPGFDAAPDGTTMRDIDMEAIQAAIRAAEGPTAARPNANPPNVARHMADDDANSADPGEAVQRSPQPTIQRAPRAPAARPAAMPDAAPVVDDSGFEDVSAAPIQRSMGAAPITYPEADQGFDQGTLTDAADWSNADDGGGYDGEPVDPYPDSPPDDFGGGPGTDAPRRPTRAPSSGAAPVARAYQPSSANDAPDFGSVDRADFAAPQAEPSYQDLVDAAIRRAEGPTPVEPSGADGEIGPASPVQRMPAAPAERTPAQSTPASGPAQPASVGQRPAVQRAPDQTPTDMAEPSVDTPPTAGPASPVRRSVEQRGATPADGPAASPAAGRRSVQRRRDDASTGAFERTQDEGGTFAEVARPGQAAPGASIMRHLADDASAEAPTGETAPFADDAAVFAGPDGAQASIQRAPDFDRIAEVGNDPYQAAAADASDDGYEPQLQAAIRRAEGPTPVEPTADSADGSGDTPSTPVRPHAPSPGPMVSPGNTAQRAYAAPTSVPDPIDESSATWNTTPFEADDNAYQGGYDSPYAESAAPVDTPAPRVQRMSAADLPYTAEQPYPEDPYSNEADADASYAEGYEGYDDPGFADAADNHEGSVQRSFAPSDGIDTAAYADQAAADDGGYQDSIEDAIRRAEGPTPDRIQRAYADPGGSYTDDAATADDGGYPGDVADPSTDSANPTFTDPQAAPTPRTAQRSPKNRPATRNTAQRSTTEPSADGFDAMTGEGATADTAYQQSVEEAIRRAEAPAPVDPLNPPNPPAGRAARGAAPSTTNRAQRSPASGPSVGGNAPNAASPSPRAAQPPQGEGLFQSGTVFERPNSLDEDAGIYRTPEELDLIQRTFDGRSDEPLYFDYSDDAGGDGSAAFDPYTANDGYADGAAGRAGSQPVQRYPAPTDYDLPAPDMGESSAAFYDPYADYLANQAGTGDTGPSAPSAPLPPGRAQRRATVQRSPGTPQSDPTGDPSGERLRLPPARRGRPSGAVARSYQAPDTDPGQDEDSDAPTFQPVDLAQALGYTEEAPSYEYGEPGQPGSADSDAGYYGHADAAQGEIQRAYDPYGDDPDASADSAPSATENELLQLIGLPPGTPIGRGNATFNIGSSSDINASTNSETASSVQRSVDEAGAPRRVMRAPNTTQRATIQGDPGDAGQSQSDPHQRADRTQQVDKLAQAVYKIIKARLKTDRERQQGRK